MRRPDTSWKVVPGACGSHWTCSIAKTDRRVDGTTSVDALADLRRLRASTSVPAEPATHSEHTNINNSLVIDPAAWNSLPSSVQELTDTTAVKHQLKTDPEMLQL